MGYKSIHAGAAAILAAAFCCASCGKLDDTLNKERIKIVRELESKGIYERGNMPDPPPASEQVKGYYDIVKGAYRYVVNENRDGRSSAPAIAAGDSVSFRFDARIYTSSFDNSTTYYTNIESRQRTIASGNNEFDPRLWPTVPLRIKAGDDPEILKSLQTALISCRAAGTRIVEGGDGRPVEEAIESDQVRIYLTYDIGYGNRRVNTVPGSSTLVWEVTDIRIIK